MSKRLGAVMGIVGLILSQTTRADVTSEVKAVFERCILAQNARDIEALKNILLDSPNFLWIARDRAVQGRDPALQDLEACRGTFYLDPGMAEFRTIELSGDVVQVYAPAVFIPPPRPQPQQPVQLPPSALQLPPVKFIISETMVRTSAGWRIGTILTFALNPFPGGQPC
jgi:hypothetical protein